MSKHIVILGAGYGGLLAATTIRKYLNKDQAKVTVVNQYPTHQTITELHRLAAGNVGEGHVAISLEKECDTLYSFGRKTPNNFLNGGFVAEKRNGEFFKKFRDTYCEIHSLEISREKENALKNIIANFVKEKEKTDPIKN